MIIENSVLRINFPKIPDHMILLLDQNVKQKPTLEDLRKESTSVNGFYFESAFLKT